MDKELKADINNKLQAPLTALDLLLEGKDVPKEFIAMAKKSLDKVVSMLNKKVVYVKKIVLIILTFVFCCSVASASDYFYVKRVVDGDTIVLENDERVRLIGVDTPETVHPQKPVEYFGKEASAFTKSMCKGKQVRLEYDWQRQDKYGRTLAYIYLEDGTFVNAEIVKQGYGHAYIKFPFKYLKQFRLYERLARENGIGLWAKDSPES